MCDLDEEIDQLAIEIEEKIQENDKLLEQLPEFAPSTESSRRMQRFFG